MEKERRRDCEGMCAVVTGGTGFVGWRLCQMLCERGAESVVVFDRADLPEAVTKHPQIKYVRGDIRDPELVSEVIRGANVVFHVAAVVGTFHPKELFEQVNYHGTMNVLDACKKHGISRLVLSGTPSTRFTGGGISGAKISDLKMPENFVAEYARTKALAEKAVIGACSESFFTVCVMPHQVYGPWDCLFMPQLMYAAKQGKLRVFGSGENNISICYNDNYCHALILAANKLERGSPVVGKSYIITDGGKVNLWDMLDECSVYLGYGSIKAKQRIPYWIMMLFASLAQFVSKVGGFTSRFNTFTVKMLMIDRWFNIEEAVSDLGYKPLKTTEEAWPETLEWFKNNEDFLVSRAKAGLEKASTHSSANLAAADTASC
eukprot:Plantae.Rhodophyta-Purpureofilum_apyrenoidigerum.ctg407.p1 GENE.Plantae.Rhodophyta-Purpureofilum_apyrenoidigerum.ctg407~~Plantae.Rhodophyta-Purpureofilum_apyrenoidigerum.ctg407.p1  ORF type:complete len:412 (-),score=57.13 Plantae.Rhodophyta-Purpureofilum_apyrenoidigerum.ctg407:15-1142(-)